MALTRQFKAGYTLERTGGGHWRIRDPHSTLVEYKGRPLQFSGNPKAGSLRAIEEQLHESGVMRGSKMRVSDEAKAKRDEAFKRGLAARQQQRQIEANELTDRYVRAFGNIGGIEQPGFAADLARVGTVLARELPQMDGRRIKTPDLLLGSAIRMLNRGWVETEYSDVWKAVVERIERAPEPMGEWWNLVREARGLPADHVEVRLPKDAQDEWPFRVELLPLDALLSDHENYQRPVGWPFVRREAARYDPSLVGTIDVSQRSPGRFAILDGQQRFEIVRLVGKTTIWCSIYVGLDIQSEARFFLRKNRDRKTMHPYYTFRAALTSGDTATREINATVVRHGYRLAIGAPNDTRPENIAAISAVQSVYDKRFGDGTPVLDATLGVLKASTYGREHGQDAVLIRGVGRTLLERPEIDRDVLAAMIATRGPDLILGRARDLKRNTYGVSGEQAISRVLLGDYDRETRAKRRAA